MKTIEELKKKQPELKEALQEVMDFINSECYFNLTSSEKSLVNQYRAGVEVALNAVTNITYGDLFTYDSHSSMMLPLLMGSIFTSPFGSPSIDKGETEKASKNTEAEVIESESKDE